MSKSIKWSDSMIECLVDLKEKEKSYKEISKHLTKKYKVKITANAVRKAYERYKFPIIEKAKKINGPKILILDIETSPLLGNVWSLWNNNLGLNQLVKDWHIMSWSAKWYGNDEITYMDQRKAKNIENDSKILKPLWKMMDEADIIVSHNGKSFDIKKLNARFILNGMKPPSSFRNIDTKILAKKHFGFTSNKLAYLTDKLCTKYKKLSHGKYPGQELWTQCLKGNIDAWNEMEEYNKYDVLSLEELYEKLIPWDDSINFTVYFEEDVCSCGSSDFVKNGIYYTNASRFQKYKCNDCGKEYRDREKLDVEKSLRTTNRRG
jgi:uncharacterized protein YprB with RNaseH-like and TPR domain